MGLKYAGLVIGSLPEPLQTASLSLLELQQSELHDAIEKINDGQWHAIILCVEQPLKEAQMTLGMLRQDTQIGDTPLICLTSDNSVEDTIALFNSGADDVIPTNTPSEEFIARINKAIINLIANRQLKSQLQFTHDVAMSAMTDSGDMGVNINFLLDSADCNNFDELGQRLFQALNNYDVRCSLQIRGRFEEKNMEPNGLSRDLESRLLRHFQDAGRLHAAGRRLFINFDQVSLLVKNMPLGDDKRCGRLRDNLFYLVQGMDSRVKALDDRRTTELQVEILKQLTSKAETVLDEIDKRYADVADQIISATENAAEQMVFALNTLGLSEEQEHSIMSIIDNAIFTTNDIFHQGLRVNPGNRQLIQQISEMMKLPPEELNRALEQFSLES
ncbi:MULTISPECIES: response regulator [unclassified Hahella]|uniref:response regulator n=1 Tax=unclassified Hahella TaxID=2624107 RepID=UPI001C1ED374|nr:MULTISPECIES: hypothetical protein [unclassified Hahella]MBU6954262.1 hypothetical protein [Hahella sp. HN01]MDG9666114.1 hypothetical protein [Hahella sp. CR1]